MTRLPAIAALIAAAALSACAAGPDRSPFGERLASEGGAIADLGERWTAAAAQIDEGREMIEDGEELIEDGEDDVSRGEKLVSRGEDQVARGRKARSRGQDLVREGERIQARVEQEYRDRGGVASPAG